MSTKHARVEAIRKLKEQLELAKDPDTVLRITNQIARLTPRPRQARRPRNKGFGAVPKKGTSPIVAKWADRLSHVQPDSKRIETTVICEVEERRKKPGCAEVRAVMGEVMGMLSDSERAILSGGGGEAEVV